MIVLSSLQTFSTNSQLSCQLSQSRITRDTICNYLIQTTSSLIRLIFLSAQIVMGQLLNSESKRVYLVIQLLSKLFFAGLYLVQSHLNLNNHQADLTISSPTINFMTIAKFWQLDKIPSPHNDFLTVEEAEWESHFQSTHSRDHTGRYTVRLPFKSSFQQLGYSMHITTKCLN